MAGGYSRGSKRRIRSMAEGEIIIQRADPDFVQGVFHRHYDDREIRFVLGRTEVERMLDAIKAAT